MSDELYALSCGPDARVNSYSTYVVNSVKFIVKSRDDRRQTQNCGVATAGTHVGIEDDYYGYVEEIIELVYIKDYRVVLFKCKWFDTDRRRKHIIYEPHFISIDTSREVYQEDIFVFTTQVRQVFYIDGPSKSKQNWKIIQRLKHRHLWDIPVD